MPIPFQLPYAVAYHFLSMVFSHFQRYKLEYIFYILVISLTGLLTYPSWLNFSQVSYGSHHPDHIGTLYGFWWLQYSLQNNLSHENFLISQPFGLDKDFSMPQPLWFFLVRFLGFFFNHIATYNTLTFLSFPLTFLTCSLFLNYCTKEKLSSYMGAFIFTFCPYHLSRSLAHISLAHIELLPLAFLSLFLLADRPSFKRSLLCVFSFLLVAISDYYYAFFIGILAIIFFLLRVISFRISWPEFKAYLVFGALFFIGFYLFFKNQIITLLFKVPSSQTLQAGLFKPDFQYLFRFSAKPLSYLLPFSDNPFFGKLSRFFAGSPFFGYSDINYLEQIVFIGFTTLFLAFLGLKLFKKENKYLFWTSIILGLSFLILSFSPYWEFETFKIYFPSYFLYQIIPTFKSYGRFGILFLLVIVVFSAFGFKRLTMYQSIKTKSFIALVFIFLILFEFLNIPPFHAVSFTKIPEVYAWLKQEDGDFIVAEYPLDVGNFNWETTYFQSVHHKKLLNGCREGSEACKIILNLKDLKLPNVPNYLAFLGIKYILYHSEKPLESIQGLRLVRSFDTPAVWVYEIQAKPKRIEG